MSKPVKKDPKALHNENSKKNNVATLAEKDQEYKELQEAKALKARLGRPKSNEPKATEKITIYLIRWEIKSEAVIF